MSNRIEHIGIDREILIGDFIPRSTYPESSFKEFSIKHSDIRSVLQLTHDFYLPTEASISYLVQESDDVANLLSSIEGYVVMFSTGFPFYAIDKNKKPILVEEIGSFIEDTKQLTDKDEMKNPEEWNCPVCQKRYNLPNINEYCKPCEQVYLKPRKIISTIPDLDVTILLEKPNLEIEAEMKARLVDLGYTQSDIDIYRSIQETHEVLECLRAGSQTKVKFPIDLHIWTRDDFDRCLEKMNRGETKIEIPTRSLHTDWVDDKMDFWFDFVFSLTPNISRDKSINMRIQEARRILVNRYSMDEIITLVGSMSSRAQRLVNCAKVREVLVDRIETWK